MSVLINFEILEYNPTSKWNFNDPLDLISISGLKLAIKCENKQIEDNVLILKLI